MFNTVNIYSLQGIVDPIENAIIPGSNAIAVLIRQLKTSGRTRVFRKGADFLEDSNEDRSLQFIEVFLSCGEEEEFIHGVS
jgi:hypothetical protein